jgi:hypothetical protein
VRKTWLGHCLGASCKTFDDCDNDWICVNNVCSVCCETGSTSDKATNTQTTTTAITSTGASTSPHKELSTGSAVGIGLGIVAFLAAFLGVAFWIWRGRRRRQELPVDSTSTDRPPPLAGDSKHLLDNASRAEMPDSTVPAELSSVELVELEAPEDQRSKDTHVLPVTVPAEATSRQRYHFQEYETSPGNQREPRSQAVSEQPSTST